RASFVEALSGYPRTQDDRHAQTARAAAEGLGRLRDKDGVSLILETIGYCGKDRVLEQSLIRALIDIEAAASTRAGLKSDKPGVQRAALIALDQMDGSDLKASDVLPFLRASDERLRAAANWIVGHHPDWGDALAGFFRERLADQNLSETDREELQRQLAQLTRNPAIQELVGEVSGNPAASKETRLVALRAMAQASLKETPGAWTNTLPRALAEADDTIVQAAIAAVRALPAAKTNAFDFSAQLLRVGRDLSRAKDVRLDSLSAMREGLNSI